MRARVLEDRLRRARAYLTEAKQLIPAWSDKNFDSLLGPAGDLTAFGQKDSSQNPNGTIDSMMNRYGQSTVNPNNPTEQSFYGAASGLAWLHKTNDHFAGEDSDDGSRHGNDEDSDSLHVSETSAMAQLFDAPLPTGNRHEPDLSISQLLPPQSTAERLQRAVFHHVYPVFRPYVEADFQTAIDRIYKLDPINYSEQDHAFLPLLCLVVGLGYLVCKEEHAKHGCQRSVDQAMRHFLAARAELDLIQLRTVESLQCMICIILFLISTARMASAHACLGSTWAAAMRQGLHFRSTHDNTYPASWNRTRRQLFWAVVNLDLYTSGILGLPPFVEIGTVDPAIDLTIEATLNEVGDQALTADEQSAVAHAKHVELMRTVYKAQQTLFPKPVDPPNSHQMNGTISISVADLQKIEDQYSDWSDSFTSFLPEQSDSMQSRRCVALHSSFLVPCSLSLESC
jgi:hypothetical protein